MIVQETFFADLGLWLGLGLSLFLFSFLIRDNVLARLAQHVLAGVVVGYLALMAWHEVLYARVVLPLSTGDGGALWIPAGLGVVLLVAGVQRILAQTYPERRDRGAMGQAGLFDRILFNLGRLPVAILLGAGVGVAIVGAVEGTLLPQYLRGAQIAFVPGGEIGRVIIGLLTLLLTTGVMVHLYVDPDRLAPSQPSFVRNTLAIWSWIGRHAFWLAAGILFARLLAARMSLLVAQLQLLLEIMAQNPLVMWIQSRLGG